MKPWVILGGSLLLTAGAAVLLPQLYSWDLGSSAVRSTAAVLSPQQRVTLTDDNLVDTLHSLPLTTPIARVSWEHSTLTLDVKLTEGGAAPTEVYQNMGEITAFCFYGTNNVKQLLLRVVAEDQWTGERHLLVASDIRRNEWPPQALTELRSWVSPELPESLKSWFRVTDTKLWRSMYNNGYSE